MADFEKKPFTPAEGDWTCEDTECGNINYARRTECNRCKAPRPMKGGRGKPGGIQIGKHLAEKSKGLFSAEDWQCATCGNVNWARRSDCNLCHAPKHGKIEERTGAGGGFNERGTVEYKSDIESDGEYDDFGRPKKKKRQSGGSVPEVPSEPLPKEESGDEEDMGRYALDTDEEGSSSGSSSDSSDSEEENKKRPWNKQNNKKRSKSPVRSDRKNSRSRSRSRSRNDRSRSRNDRSRSRDRKSSSRDIKSRDRKSCSRDNRDSRSTSRKRSRSPIRSRRISRGSPEDRKDRTKGRSG